MKLLNHTDFLEVKPVEYILFTGLITPRYQYSKLKKRFKQKELKLKAYKTKLSIEIIQWKLPHEEI